jgi:hypothetical protein
MATMLSAKPLAVRATASAPRASRAAVAVRAAARVAPASRSTFMGAAAPLAGAAPRRAAAGARRACTVEAAKKSVGDLTEAELKGKTVFVRADLNVPLDKELNITDDTRIRVRRCCARRGRLCAAVACAGWHAGRTAHTRPPCRAKTVGNAFQAKADRAALRLRFGLAARSFSLARPPSRRCSTWCPRAPRSC